MSPILRDAQYSPRRKHRITSSIVSADLSQEQGAHTRFARKNPTSRPAILKKRDLSVGEAILLQEIEKPTPEFVPIPPVVDLNIELSLEPEVIAEEAPLATQESNMPVVDYSAIQQEVDDFKIKAMQKVEQEVTQYRQTKLLDIDREKKNVMESAFDEGYQEGQKKGESLLQSKAQELIHTINSLCLQHKSSLEKKHKEILDLALIAAEHILKTEISRKPESMINIVKDAIRKITDKNQVIIRVNTHDLAIVQANRQNILALMSDIKSLTVQEDNLVDQGGCIIETTLGYIDSTISTKLESIKKAIFDVYIEEVAENVFDETGVTNIDFTEQPSYHTPVTSTYVTTPNTRSASDKIRRPIPTVELEDEEFKLDDDFKFDSQEDEFKLEDTDLNLNDNDLKFDDATFKF